MTVRLACLMVALASGAFPGSAKEAGPVCGRPEVLAKVADGLAQSGLSAAVDLTGAGQVPTADGRIVRCAVRLTTQYFDTNHYGFTPQYQTRVFEYFVRAGRNGLFVSAVDGSF